ncbi:MAG: SPFH domain-containing protein [Anaerolineae bacterium]|nr:SPFH domain-containing protein [Anaerolineae bacterium]
MAIIELTAVFLLCVLGFFALRRWAYVRVPELELAVVKQRGSNKFLRFLSAGGHWLLPFREEVNARIDLSPSPVKGKTAGLQTIGGLSLTIMWELSFSLDLLRIPAQSQPKIARLHSKKTAVTAKNHLSNSLHHILGNYTVEQLTLPGAHQKLEEEVMRQVTRRLSPLGYDISRVMIDAIDMPPQVKAALETAHEQEMQREVEARALSRLQQVISQFSDADMERLIELERIHKGQSGMVLPYPTLFEQGNGRYAQKPYSRMAQ